MSIKDDTHFGPWRFTIARVCELPDMKEKKSWKPIVTLKIDEQQHEEVVMGCDGQNPNLTSACVVDGSRKTSQLRLEVWHCGQTKKRRRRRNLVASCSHSLGYFARQSDHESNHNIDNHSRHLMESVLKLELSSSTKCPKPAGRRQLPITQGPHIHLRFVAPPPSKYLDVNLDDGELDDLTSLLSPCESETSSCDWNLFPPPAISVHAPPPEPYDIDSEDDLLDGTTIGELTPLLKDDIDLPPIDNFPEGLLPSILPQHMDVTAVTPPVAGMSRMESVLSSMTVYRNLRDASLDSEFELVFGNLNKEWKQTGEMLLVIAAINGAIFVSSNDSIVKINPVALTATAVSSTSSGLGILCFTWFLVRYTWAGTHTCIRRAKDIFDSYIFFAISAHVPRFCLIIAVGSLIVVLGAITYDVRPEVVLVACSLVGVLMTMQFLAKAAVLSTDTIRSVGRHTTSRVSEMSRRLRGSIDPNV